MNLTNVLGFKFANSDIVEAVEQGMRLMEERKSLYVVAPNTELLQQAGKNKRLKAAIDNAALVLPEGNGIIYASHILGMPIKNRISADDYASALMARMSEKGMSVFIICDDQDLQELAAERMSLRYPGLKIVGADGDYYSNDIELIDGINSYKPDLLLVCHGSPRQELWMYRNREQVETGLMLGYGEGLKLLAQVKERAPKRWRDSGFEWLYWLIKEPKRIPRMIKRTGLIFSAIWYRLAG